MREGRWEVWRFVYMEKERNGVGEVGEDRGFYIRSR